MKRGKIVLVLFLGLAFVLPTYGQLIYTNLGVTADRDLTDTNADNLGDVLGTIGNATIQVGENTSSSITSELRGTLVFNIASLTNEIHGATNVTLNVRYTTANGAPVPFNVDVLGLDGFRTSTTLVASDFQAAASLLKSSFVTNGQTINTFYTIDVTSFAQNQGAGGASVLMFRFQSSDPSIPDADGTLRRFSFSSADAAAGNQPFLTIAIPEPSPMLFTFIAFGLCLVFRRIRNRSVTGS